MCLSTARNRGTRPSSSGVSLLAHARRVATRQRADTTCGWSWRASPPRVACETNFLRVRAPLSRRGLLGGAGRAHAARPAVVRASAFYRDARVGGGRAAPREWFKESSSRRRFHTHLALVRPFLAFKFFFHLFRLEPTRLPCTRHSVALASRRLIRRVSRLDEFTLCGGSLGSCVDEERSQLRELM